MSPPFLLDTSALLVHYCGEAGHDVVGQLLQEHADGVFLTWPDK